MFSWICMGFLFFESLKPKTTETKCSIFPKVSPQMFHQKATSFLPDGPRVAPRVLSRFGSDSDSEEASPARRRDGPTEVTRDGSSDEEMGVMGVGDDEGWGMGYPPVI
jgi:hypothetical protein